MGHEAYIRIVDGSHCAVLMVHGIVGTPRHFDCLLSCFPENWSVYNILLDGHGGSVQEFSHSSMKRWQNQTSTWLTALCKQYDTVIVMGHSMGTLLLLQESANYPQVKAMILLNCPLKPWVRAEMTIRLLRICFNRIDETNLLHRVTRDASSVAFTKKLWQYLGFIPRYIELLKLCKQTQPLIQNISIPCYACHSAQDELVSIRSARFFRNHPMIWHEVLPHSGHFYYEAEDLRRIRSGIQRILDSISQHKEYSNEQ